MATRWPRGRHPLNCTYLFTSRQPAGAVKALTAEKMNEWGEIGDKPGDDKPGDERFTAIGSSFACGALSP